MTSATRTSGDHLEAFLAAHPAISQHRADWAEGAIELAISTHLISGDTPPIELVTSGRCIVLAPAGVLVMTNPGERHITPGGRLEPGEDPRAATIREVREEAGITLADLVPLALVVHRHLTPCPVDYPYPYPVFTNLIFVSRLDVTPAIDADDEYEQGGEFLPVAMASEVLPPRAQVLLAAALDRVGLQGSTGES